MDAKSDVYYIDAEPCNWHKDALIIRLLKDALISHYCLDTYLLT